MEKVAGQPDVVRSGSHKNMKKGIEMSDEQQTRKLQYIYVFFADASALAVSVLLVWLVLDRVFHRITAYSMSDWLLALIALATAFLAAFLCFDQSENIVGRSLEKEIRLSLEFNILMGALYALLMMLVKAQMLESGILR